jgi:hypothetical protein
MNQNPEKRFSATRKDGAFPAFLFNWARLWSPVRSRWLSAKEHFALMGWPVRKDIAKALGVKMVDVAKIPKAHAMIGIPRVRCRTKPLFVPNIPRGSVFPSL